MYIAVVSWLITKSISMVYLICLVGVTTENIIWSKGGNVLERNNTMFLFAGGAWFWSNKGIGLICSIVFMTRHTRSVGIRFGRDPTHLFRGNSGSYWNILHSVECLLQSFLGVLWWWSHKKLLLCLVLVRVIATLVDMMRPPDRIEPDNTMMLPPARIDSDNTDADQENNASSGEGMRNLTSWLLLLILLLFLSGVYICIRDLVKSLWRSLYRSMLPLRPPSQISIHIDSATMSSDQHSEETSTLSSSQDTSSKIGPRDLTKHRYWQSITTGHNVNQGGTQTIGSVLIGDYIHQIQANGCQDIIYNQFILPDIGRNYFSTLAFLLFLALVLVTYYFHSVCGKTATETCPLLSMSGILFSFDKIINQMEFN